MSDMSDDMEEDDGVSASNAGDGGCVGYDVNKGDAELDDAGGGAVPYPCSVNCGDAQKGTSAEM